MKLRSADEAAHCLSDALHLRLTDAGEERQRERSPRHVLADRELTLAPAEALAVEAHEVDGGQVRLRLDALLPQRDHRRVAVDSCRELHHVDEPTAPGGAC